MGRFIAELRKKQNLTQAQLGELLGVTDKTVSKWERAARAPDISILNKLSSILNVTTTELLNGERLLGISYHNYDGMKYYQELVDTLVLFINNHYDTCYMYLMESVNPNYYINGLMIESSEKHSLSINYVRLLSQNIIISEQVYSCEYSLSIQNQVIYKIGNILLYDFNPWKRYTVVDDILRDIKMYITREAGIELGNGFSSMELLLTIKYLNQELRETRIEVPFRFKQIISDHKIMFHQVNYC